MTTRVPKCIVCDELGCEFCPKVYYAVQADYGYGDGFEDVTAEDTRDEAVARLREYRENDAYAKRLRIVRRHGFDPYCCGDPGDCQRSCDGELV